MNLISLYFITTEKRMRKKIITLFIILFIFQTVQVATVIYSIQKLQKTVRQVTLTVEAREVSKSTSNLLNQFRDSVVLIAGMNFPVTGLNKIRKEWEVLFAKFESMFDLAEQLSLDPGLLNQIKQHIKSCAKNKGQFEKTILTDSLPETYTSRIHDAAFELDESIEGARKILNVLLVKFVETEGAASVAEHKTHNLPIQVVIFIGILIGGILIFTGSFALKKIVNPLIDLTVKYQVAMQKLKKEQEIALALEKARALAQAKSDFLANMSHELRTPMNAILGFSQLLSETELDGKQKDHLDLIMSSGQHLVQIINDILDFSKLESGKIELEEIDFNLEKLCNEVMKISTAKMAEHPLDTYIDYPSDIPKHIKSDPTRLKQVLVNLVSNAIKFTHEGEGGLIVSLNKELEHREGEFPLKISVKDSGIGILKNKIDKIFESFTQIDESTTRKYGGTGLGLTISKSIIEAMGGRIWVESQEGKGSQFTFTIKVKKGQPVDPLGVDETAVKLLEGKKVFIIDDNLISQKIVNKICKSIPTEVLFIADSGHAALQKLDELSQNNIYPDFILCDIMMSGMYGYTVAQKIRNNKYFDAAKIIAVTKMSERDVSHYIRDDCFNTYLIKPVSRVDMVNVLAKSSGYVKSEVRKPKEIKPLTKEDEAKFENIKILVAENNPSNLKLIESFLSKLKCKVDYVYNGEEAVRKLEANKYNLCLMDLQMPILGGIEAAKKIRKRISKSLPIIALTAAVLKEDRIKAEEAGMNDFLDKPIDMVKLKEKILQYGTKEIEPEESQKEKRKIKALVVDDNVLNMKLLVALLKKSDCESDTAEDGKIAVEKAKSNEYDICFMDIQMPVMGGVEATKIIREEVSKDLPVIAVTAVKDFTLEKSLDAEMNGCIHKPIDINMLKKILAEYCPLV